MKKYHGYEKILSPRIREIVPAPHGRRLNLILPSIDIRHQFGGINTAIGLFKSLAAEFDYARLISISNEDETRDASTWAGWNDDSAAFSERSIASMRSPSDELPIFAGDYFIATSGQTAILAKSLLEQQRKLFPRASSRKYIYFIQEYEPGFYPYSYEYFQASNSYDDAESAIAIFNMARLRDYFGNQSIRFRHQYVFEPKLNPELLSVKSSPDLPPKERLIVAYARPSVPRNAFPLVVDSLRVWARTFKTADQWSVVSWGNEHEDIELSDSIRLRSLGRLSLREYALCLSRCWVGLAFVYLAHPAFSRLDYLEFDSWLITNSFAGNDISDLSPKVLSLEAPTPAVVAEKLAWCCSKFVAASTSTLPSTPTVFSTAAEELPCRREIIECLVS